MALTRGGRAQSLAYNVGYKVGKVGKAYCLLST